MHQAVHRDLKPSNIIYDPSRGIQILDWPGGGALTLIYASPEQISAKQVLPDYPTLIRMLEEIYGEMIAEG